MTSIPASRRTRAMIFAPRSCPSRPGLATTTRILRPLWGALGAVRGLPSIGLERRGGYSADLHGHPHRGLVLRADDRERTLLGERVGGGSAVAGLRVKALAPGL